MLWLGFYSKSWKFRVYKGLYYIMIEVYDIAYYIL